MVQGFRLSGFRASGFRVEVRTRSRVSESV